jgi:hypothetical protein
VAFDYLQTNATSLRFCSRPLSGVAPVHVRQLYRPSGRFLDGLGRLSYLLALLVGWADEQGEQMS